MHSMQRLVMFPRLTYADKVTLLAFITKIIFHNVKVCSGFMLQMVTLVSF